MKFAVKSSRPAPAANPNWPFTFRRVACPYVLLSERSTAKSLLSATVLNPS